MKRANNRIKLKAAEQKNLYDKSELEIGSRVLLRNRVKGRYKIQDAWNPTSYICKETGREGGLIPTKTDDVYILYLSHQPQTQSINI